MSYKRTIYSSYPSFKLTQGKPTYHLDGMGADTQ